MRISIDRHWHVLLLSSAVFLAVLLQIPQLIHFLSPMSQGVFVHINSDEHQYLARVEEALNGTLDQADEPYTGDASVQNMQPALLEQGIGILFGWTGWSAATVLQILDSVVTPLLFLTLISFFLAAGFSRGYAFAGAWLFIVSQIYYLNRPVHQGMSFLCAMLALLLCTHAVTRGKRSEGVLGGILLGLLLGVYFWSWTYAWAWMGLVCVWFLWNRAPNTFAVWRCVPCVAAGLVTASPFVIRMVLLMRHPLSEEVVYRTGLISSHLPESWPYSILFFGMALGLLVPFFQTKSALRSQWAAVAACTAGFIVLNQQVLHGTILQFASHYSFPLTFAAVCCILLSIRHFKSSRWLFISLMASAVFLCGMLWDNRGFVHQFIPAEVRYPEQHFSRLPDALHTLPKSVFLSDRHTLAFVAAYSNHDIVYSLFLQNALLSHEQIAERFCLTQLAVPPEFRPHEMQTYMIWPEANRTYGESAQKREKELILSACARLDADPPAALKAYGIRHVIWDKKWHPYWDVSRLGVSLEEIAHDDGWVLYRITQ